MSREWTKIRLSLQLLYLCSVNAGATNINISTLYKFFQSNHFQIFNIQNQMPDHTVNINLDKNVFDKQNIAKRLWSCLGQNYSRFSIVSLSQSLILLFFVCDCFWRMRLDKTYDEFTV